MSSIFKQKLQIVQNQEFIKRLITAFFLAFTFALVSYVENSSIFKLIITVVSFCVLVEWNILCQINGLMWYIFPFSLALCFVWLPIEACKIATISCFLIAQVLLIYFFRIRQDLLFQLKTSEYLGVLIWASGVLLICNGFIACTRLFSDHKFSLILCVLAVAISDVSGYICGKALPIGQPFPKLSPNKTLSGTIAMICVPWMIIPVAWWYSANISLVLISCAGIIALWGDLWMSLIKRVQGVKHTGSSLPGHGGWLDRLDSHVMVLASYQLFQSFFWVIH